MTATSRVTFRLDFVLPQILIPTFRRVRLQLDNDEWIENGNDEDRKDESEEQGVGDVDPHRRRLRSSIGHSMVQLWAPARVGLGRILAYMTIGEHGEEGQPPGGAYDEDGIPRHTVAFGKERKTDGEEPIAAHHGQREGTDEHVDACQHVVDLAEGVAEQPATNQRRRHDERKSEQEDPVGDWKVEDVVVRDRLEFRKSGDHVNDQTVSDQAHQTDDPVNGHQNERSHTSGFVR